MLLLYLQEKGTFLEKEVTPLYNKIHELGNNFLQAMNMSPSGDERKVAELLAMEKFLKSKLNRKVMRVSIPAHTTCRRTH